MQVTREQMEDRGGSFMAMVESLPVQCTVNGPWLAGGAIRRALMGKPPADFDFFFASQEQYDEVYAKLGEPRYTNKFNATFDVEGMKVQIIMHKFFADVDELIDSFDYTICQFVWDGEGLHYPSVALIDAINERLVVHKITYGISSMRRLIKYTSQGYHACKGCLAALARGSFASLQDHIEYID